MSGYTEQDNEERQQSELRSVQLVVRVFVSVCIIITCLLPLAHDIVKDHRTIVGTTRHSNWVNAKMAPPLSICYNITP